MPGIKRNLEAGGGLYINKFVTGLYSQRSPLFAPMSAMGVQLIMRQDSLWDGVNVDISHNMTLVRRPGFARYCSTAFGVSDYPLTFCSFKNIAGTIKPIVDTPTKVQWFSTSALSTVITKNTTAQSSFTRVGDTVYICDGNDSDSKKWDGTTATKWGITAPVTAPTLSFTAGSLSPTRGYQYVYVYKNSSTGHISTASPVSANTLALTSKNITVQGSSSSDAQVDKVDIYRNTDGGSTFYYLTTINNGGTWSYTDSTADTGLNTFLQAPLANQNDPPPSGIYLSCFYLGRVWVASGSDLYFGGGSDITNGVPEECFPPANVFTFPGKLTALVPTSQGLVAFTQDAAWVILGTAPISFYPKLWQANFGVRNSNCVAQDGDLLFVFTSNKQLFQFSSTLEEIGFPIQSRLAAFDPATTYLALHRSGADEGLFITDGSQNVYRYSVALSSWSTPYQPVGGIRCLSSIEVSTGSYQLLMGRTSGSGYILNRDTTVFSDDGTAYSANVILGNLVLAPPRQTAQFQSVLLEALPIGTYPTISVLLNEVSGTFTALPNPVPDPPELAASTTIWMKRHDRAAGQAPLPAAVRHMQVKVTFATEAAANEILGLAID